jgi:hypothetical protein
MLTRRSLLLGRKRVAEDGIPEVTEVFPRVSASVPAVRRLACAAMRDWDLPGLADSAELVACELASNAVLHARRGAFRVTFQRVADDRVRVAVADCSRVAPVKAAADDDEDHGRGLALAEGVSQEWGTDLLTWGKRVWAELELPPKPEPPTPALPIYSTPLAQVVYVLTVIAVAAAIVVAAAHS